MSRVSLRMRLILAVGVVALLALALADVAVYASLKSYLYRQVDSTLQVAQQSVEAAATQPSGSAPSGTGASPGGQQPSGRPSAPSGGRARRECS
jgi:hypothetical protein